MVNHKQNLFQIGIRACSEKHTYKLVYNAREIVFRLGTHCYALKGAIEMNDCRMSKDLVVLLWKKGIISDQDYENLFYVKYARNLKDPENKEYADKIAESRRKR